MRRDALVSHNVLNLLHTIALFVAMIILLGLLGYVLGGVTGLFWAAVGAIPFLLVGRQASPQLVLRLYGAMPLKVAQAPRLYQIVQELASRAGLDRAPNLYYIPSQIMNAFSVGSRRDAALGVTDGLVRGLNTRELIAVLAHEISHIRQNDMKVMAFADLVSRLTGFFATVGQILLVLNLPLLFMGMSPFPWLGVLLLIVAPILSDQIQLALSRAREVDADLGGARLSGDPVGLASALQKMEHFERNLFRRLLVPGNRIPDPSVLRTHPKTRDRVGRLLELAQEREPSIMPDTRDVSALPDDLTRQVQKPRWHITGFW